MLVVVGIVATMASSITIAFAQNMGTYTITATPSYAHPVTGAVEDRGQNAVIGQSMTESFVDQTALLEVYDNDENYVTIRCNLMDNVGKVQFSYQLDAQSEFIAIQHAVMQVSEDGTSADMRFALPSSDVIVKASIFITPMGRDIVMFMTFTDPIPGSADFIVTSPQPISEGAASTVSLADQQTATSPPPAQADSPNTQVVIFVVATIAAIALIAIIGFVVYKRKAADAKP